MFVKKRFDVTSFNQTAFAYGRNGILAHLKK